ncbi:PleD family two-component system response regulator [Mariniflexile sp.]|uniref:response regulator n=1 Tax=Mariniflexile sp. TaxID=1979402 RepID=UPI003561DA1D
MKILAIDDQQLVLLTLQKRFEELGFKVRVATDAIKGLDLFDTFKPNLVIVDINMPKISGIELIKRIRTSKKSSTPIMVLSGNTSDDVFAKGFEYGISDYMKKPINLEEVTARVKRLNIFFQTF